MTDDWDILRSKILTLSGNGWGQHTKYKPNAFTERGLYMLATILKSPVATQTTIAIVDAFAKLRELTNVACQLVAVQDINSQESLMIRGGDIISEIFDETIMNVIGNETSFELNLGAFKVKHTVKREKRIT
ncbi:MAG: ORF6N domain-containing protein [Oscillospiraceae bacterium]|nr:ORF6N domain-containing protein [Oscillospiraceae bacterium]